MTGRPYWIKPGVRADPGTAERRRAQARAAAGRAAYYQAKGDAKARSAWETGRIRPSTITQALDACGLDGPEVDEACGGAEPMVDMWEAGELYPTWEQLQALAVLTGYPLAYFANEHVQPPTLTMCGTDGCKTIEPPDRPHKFTRAALDEAGINYSNPHRKEHH